MKEFEDIFPSDLPDLPPSRNHVHEIHLEPGSKPFSRSPYRMSPAELVEVKKVLEELLAKGYI